MGVGWGGVDDGEVAGEAFDNVGLEDQGLASSYAQNCNNFAFSNNAIYATCVTLPVLNSHLHWNYYPSNGSVDLAFRRTGSDTSQWVAWALNVDRSGMIGAQSLVAISNSNGSIRAYTTSVNSYGTTMQPSVIDHVVGMLFSDSQ
ncbi:hypothetical protein L1987_84746 [Smallanthus sonchifolius]|uniref:Uncharacterized protein n=1 Tax=Smallanthus sonchifolius TaxID=185202 RepID=A0ACB8XV56_9ASTR|nr:hypothetical protein L1987_84746 [Smallanthus sonchifolius]